MLTLRSDTKESIHQFFDEIDAISVQGYDEQRRVIYWNRGSEIVYGYTEAEALGKKLEELIIPEYMREVIISAHEDWINKGIAIPASEITLCNKDGEDVNVFSSHVILINKDDQYEMYCIDVNLADVRQAQDQANFKENMLEAVFNATPDLFFLMKEDGTIIDYHAGDQKNLYVSPEYFCGKAINEFLPEGVSEKFKSNLAKVISQGGVSTFEYKLSLPHGEVYFEARANHLKAYKQVVIIVRDITEQFKATKVIRQHAYYDALTLLPNRFLSLDRLSQMLEESKRNAKKSAVLFLDLDDFKKINDSLGHEVGDKLLIKAADRLKRAVRKVDTVGRLGGDEFLVLLQSIADEYDAANVADNLLTIFNEPFDVEGRELIVTLSIGVAIYPDNGDSISDLLRNSDTAMYQAKTLGRNTYSFFTKQMNDVILRRFSVEEQLRGALECNQFEVHYQPKVNVKSGDIIGVEALLRWHNPRLGSVAPDEFIPIAENTGLIVAIGKYVIEQSIKFLKQWSDSHQQNYTMAVNLSPVQFRDKQLIHFIKQSLASANIKPENLELEITEGVLMIGKSYIEEALDELNQLGVKLSMDDFGTGYSSLSYLRQYSFDVLKIDRSFINYLTVKKADFDLVKATIAMAHSLGLLVVAEGVEEREQLKLLEQLGCDLAQGYYFSKPMPAKQLLDYHHAP